MSKDKKKKDAEKKDEGKRAAEGKKKDEGKKDSKQTGKRLCKWDKDDIDKDLARLKELVIPARFICRRCGRVAKESSSLCKPVEL
jgi:hypothetical protein